MQTISTLFDRFDHAASAVGLVKDVGVTSDDISLVAKNADGLIHEQGHAHSETKAPKAVGLGAATGAGMGFPLDCYPGYPGYWTGRRGGAAASSNWCGARCHLWEHLRALPKAGV